MVQSNIVIPKKQIIEFCQRNHIRKLSFFGSILRKDFRPNSDIDVLVEFESEHIPGFFRLVQLEQEFSKILGGRLVDMRTPNDLSRYFRENVLAQAEVQYVQ